MAGGFDRRRFEREMRAAQRKAEQQLRREAQKAEREINREIDRVNRENKRRVDAHNRKVDRHNKAVIDDLNRQLRAALSGPRYTASEEALADRVQQAIAQQPEREVDAFLSYARIDGSEVGGAARGIGEPRRTRLV